MSRTRTAFTLVELLVVIAIIGILVALLLPAIQAAREAARRTGCQTNLHNLAIGLQNYHDSNKTFPWAYNCPRGFCTSTQDLWQGNRIYANWAIQILPYIEEQALFDTFEQTIAGNPRPITTDTTADRSRNWKARGTDLSVMFCPSDMNHETKCKLSPNTTNGGNWSRGNYGYNGGVDTPDKYEPVAAPAVSSWSLPCYRGVGGYNLGAKISQIEDGTSKTIALAEMRSGLADVDRRGTWAMGLCGSNVHCRHFSNGAQGPNDSGDTTDDIPAADGPLMNANFEGNTSPTLRAESMTFFSWAAAQSTVRSRHPGGVHVALCDASVRFISDNVQTGEIDFSAPDICTTEAYGVWERLNASNDGFSITGEF